MLPHNGQTREHAQNRLHNHVTTALMVYYFADIEKVCGECQYGGKRVAQF